MGSTVQAQSIAGIRNDGVALQDIKSAANVDAVRAVQLDCGAENRIAIPAEINAVAACVRGRSARDPKEDKSGRRIPSKDRFRARFGK